jgi:hypothetical protein
VRRFFPQPFCFWFMAVSILPEKSRRLVVKQGLPIELLAGCH